MLFRSYRTGAKNSWFFVTNCPAGAVRGVLIVGESILIGGANGVFRSTSSDLASWERVGKDAIGEGVEALGYRWINFGLPDQRRWWRSWNGDTNLVDPDVTNTLIATSDKGVSYSYDGSTWQRSVLPITSDELFSPSFFRPLASGREIGRAHV